MPNFKPKKMLMEKTSSQSPSRFHQFCWGLDKYLNIFNNLSFSVFRRKLELTPLHTDSILE